MASIGISKQVTLRLSFVLLLCLSFLSVDAQVTRGQLLRMFYKAGSYHNAGNDEQAIETYREIATLAPRYPDTYLRMAEIYDKAGDAQSAVVMYRKYINLEMDDEKVAEPSSRLKELESNLGMQHYEEVEEKQALQLFSKYNVVQQSPTGSGTGQGEQMADTEEVQEEKLQLFGDNSSMTSDVSGEREETVSSGSADNGAPSLSLFGLSTLVATAEDNASGGSEESVQHAEEPAEEPVVDGFSLDVPLVDVSKDAVSIGEEMADANQDASNIAVAQEIVLDDDFMQKVRMQQSAEQVMSSASVDAGCDSPLLCYLKRDRLSEFGLESSEAVGTPPVALGGKDLASVLFGKWVSSESNRNGHETWVFDISQTGNTWHVSLDDASGVYIKDGEEDIFDVSLHAIKSFWSYDRTMSSRIKELRSTTVTAQIQKEVLSCTFVTEHQYKPHKTVYTWSRNILEGVADFIPFGGVVSQVGNTLINYISEKDQQKTYTTTIQLYIKAITPDAMRCDYVMTEKERSSAGEREVYRERNACFLYRADNDYRGFDFFSDNEKNLLNKKLYTLLKEESEQDRSKLYPLAYMTYYGAGTKKSVSKSLWMMQQLAEKNNCQRAKAWLVPVYYNLSMDEEAYPLRVIRKQFRNYADELLGDLLMANYPYAYSMQADIYASNGTFPDKVLPLYQKAAELGDVYALYKLGMIYTEGQLEQVDAQKAVDYLNKAAERGYADAYLQLALLHRHGKLVEKDYSKYAHYLFQAVNDGSIKAVKELSDAYFLGLGVERSFEKGNQLKKQYMKSTCEEWKEVLNVYGYNTML